jgi:hypothetical protein
MFTTFGAPCYQHMFLSFRFIEKARCQITDSWNRFPTDRAYTLYAGFAYRITVRTASYSTALVGNRHGLVYAGYEVFTGSKGTAAQRAVYERFFKGRRRLLHRMSVQT